MGCKICFSFLHIFRYILPSDKYLVSYVLVTFERCSQTHADCHVKYLLYLLTKTATAWQILLNSQY